MPRGAAVIRYDGSRGTTWSIKYVDAGGQQVRERLGRETDGWNQQKAERELGKRLDGVEKGYRKPSAMTFSAFAEKYLTEYLPGKGRKQSTVIDYTATIRNHLEPAFGEVSLARLAVQSDVFDRYVTQKMRDGLAPKTVRNHLALLHKMFKVARGWRLVPTNPIDDVEPPEVPEPDTRIYSEDETAGLLAALDELERTPPSKTDATWWGITRRMVVVALGTGLRRGELLGLRWQDIDLLEQRLRVEQQIVRGEVTSPKSKAGRRTLIYGPVVKAALEEQWQVTVYRSDEALVFGHPQLGTPLDPSKLTSSYLSRAIARAGIDDPIQPWHGLRHTALTASSAAGNPNAYVQQTAGHSQYRITERYIHAEQTAFPGAAEKTEARVFGSVDAG